MNRKAVLIIGFVVLILVHKPIGALCVNFFTIIDHILEIHPGISPFFMWGILGLLFGAIAGSLVMFKKYRLAFKWNLISIGFFLLVFGTLFAFSSPFGTKAGRAILEDDTAGGLIEIRATSSIPDYNQYNYRPENLIDNDKGTAWMYVRNRDRVESVGYLFNSKKITELKEVEIRGLRIRNGYSKNREKWGNFNRVKDFTVYHNGKPVYSGTAADKFNIDEDIVFGQQIPVNLGDTIRVDMNTIYRGNNKKTDITAVTEMIPLVSIKKM